MTSRKLCPLPFRTRLLAMGQSPWSSKNEVQMKNARYAIAMVLVSFFSCQEQSSIRDVAQEEPVACLDRDEDTYGSGEACSGPDCDDNDPNNWNSCSTCVDEDLDFFHVGCDAYTTIRGPDCDDHSFTCTASCEDANLNGKPDCTETWVIRLDREGTNHRENWTENYSHLPCFVFSSTSAGRST